MPLVVLPRALEPSDRLRARLGELLCPYDGSLAPLLAGTDHRVWGTSACVVDERGVHVRYDSGTAQLRVVQRGDAVELGTDPLGTCPLWWTRTEHGVVASPEVKAFTPLRTVRLAPDATLFAPGPRAADWSPFPDVLRVPPGATLSTTSDGAVVRGAPARFEVRAEEDDDWPRRLGATLLDAFEPSALATGAFVSGGIDSSIACALARRSGTAVAAHSLGTRHGDEFENARELAEGLGCTYAEVRLEGQLEALFDRVVLENEVFDGLTAEVLLQLAALLDVAAGSCERVVTGYGSDLLFDGMLRVEPYLEATGLRTTPELIERTRWTGELAPFVAWRRGVALEHVFWRTSVVDTALSVPRELCFVDGVEKHVLREAAVRSGLLPRGLAFREKVGLSVGTGVNRLFAEHLGVEGAFGYAEKSRAASALLRRFFERA